jgi:hypothetical protein
MDAARRSRDLRDAATAVPALNGVTAALHGQIGRSALPGDQRAGDPVPVIPCR